MSFNKKNNDDNVNDVNDFITWFYELWRHRMGNNTRSLTSANFVRDFSKRTRDSAGVNWRQQGKFTPSWLIQPVLCTWSKPPVVLARMAWTGVSQLNFYGQKHQKCRQKWDFWYYFLFCDDGMGRDKTRIRIRMADRSMRKYGWDNADRG